jgi:peroxidase
MRRSSLRRRAQRATTAPEELEIRALPSATALSSLQSNTFETYSIDGTGNNLTNPDWGSAGSDFLRTAAAAYGDGISTPAGADRPSAREVSNVMADQNGQDIVNDRWMSAMIYAWGQFIDHDLDLTNANSGESMPIAVPAGDPQFDPDGTGTQTIPLTRSDYDPETGTTTPREQVNSITAWLDGSMIYGSDATTAAALRTFSGGLLKTCDGDLLPLNNSTDLPDGTLDMANAGPNDSLFAAGDVRANENIELTSLQTLFVREHNRVAQQIALDHPEYDDEAIYQHARAWVIAEIQAITFQEWLPALLGSGAIDRYRGYDPTVNPGIANEFSTAAFRFGHSLLGDDIDFLGNEGQSVAPTVELKDAFFHPELIAENGIDPLLKYLSSDPSSEVDPMVVDSVRNFLFGPPGAGGLDLASLNIQRGRDNGIADFNSVRVAYGLPRLTSFDQITSDTDVQAKLQALYGSVDDIDAWVGILAEDHEAGSSAGPTLKAIISDQFERLRDGDRFWYQNVYSGSELRTLQKTTLADIIRRNTTITNIQDNVFYFRAGVSGTVFIDQNQNGKVSAREQRLADQTVQLVDVESGDVLATSQTDRRGAYHFDIYDGLRLGAYKIQVAVPNQNRGSAPPPVSKTVTLTKGDDFQNVNVGLPPHKTPHQHEPRNHGPRNPRHANDVAASSVRSGETTELDAQNLDSLFTNGLDAV